MLKHSSLQKLHGSPGPCCLVPTKSHFFKFDLILMNFSGRRVLLQTAKGCIRFLLKCHKDLSLCPTLLLGRKKTHKNRTINQVVISDTLFQSNRSEISILVLSSIKT